jgi:hypothetical protein
MYILSHVISANQPVLPSLYHLGLRSKYFRSNIVKQNIPAEISRVKVTYHCLDQTDTAEAVELFQRIGS